MCGYEPIGSDPTAEEDDVWYMRMDRLWHEENSRRRKRGEEEIDWDEFVTQEEMEDDE